MDAATTKHRERGTRAQVRDGSSRRVSVKARGPRGLGVSMGADGRGHFAVALALVRRERGGGQCMHGHETPGIWSSMCG